MCGIFFCCSRDRFVYPSRACRESLRGRGPDGEACLTRSFPVEGALSQRQSSEGGTLFLTFTSTVLSLRGNSIVTQPLEDRETGSLLCWNGEAWRIRDRAFDGNDSQVVFSLLLGSVQVSSSDEAMQNALSVIASIVGPHSFIFYDAQHHRVFYGRDVLGRRSLTFRNCLPDNLVISSVCDSVSDGGWAEIQTDGIYLLDLQKAAMLSTDPLEGIIHVPWNTGSLSNGLPLKLVQ